MPPVFFVRVGFLPSSADVLVATTFDFLEPPPWDVFFVADFLAAGTFFVTFLDDSFFALDFFTTFFGGGFLASGLSLYEFLTYAMPLHDTSTSFFLISTAKG